MTVLVVGLTVAVLLLGILVAGLLRSHAEILRQLHTLGAGREDTTAGGRVADLDMPGFDVRPGVMAPTDGVTGRLAHDLAGTTPSQESAAVAVTGTGHDTLLAFLSSGCLTCHTFWDVFRAGGDLGLPAGTRLVVVAKDADMESVSALRGLAPSGLLTVMSTAAWLAYGVPGSPYFVHVDGRAGRVAGEGSATAWEQVVRLVREASEDRAITRASHRHDEDHQGRPYEDRGDGAHREARADRELLAAGITPGHESLQLTADEVAGSVRVDAARGDAA